MYIKSFEVVGLFDREQVLRLDFNEDLNIVTGKNGAGKTSLLKLIWYIMSGNILQALKEVKFRKATLETSKYICTVFRLNHQTCKIEWEDSKGKQIFEDQFIDGEHDFPIFAEQQANDELVKIGSSVFFPTFRRIEGGFTLGEKNSRSGRIKNDIEDSLIALSGQLTNGNHMFVAALSTIDVVNLLVQQYTNLSEKYNKDQQKMSQEVIQKIMAYKQEATGSVQLNDANRLLDEIKREIEKIETSRIEIMRPIEAVRSLVMQLFNHSGIKLKQNLSIGDAANAINSDSLSAGEKQMLSFIAYNTFYRDAVIIIDEPELSLHVDWQRQLFSILMKQQTSNQFVIATHSPFIYSKYPDKEILIDQSRGDDGDQE